MGLLVAIVLAYSVMQVIAIHDEIKRIEAMDLEGKKRKK